ncbi:MAG: DUF1993 domain-containing protein [Lysobacter sp.]|nr:DUF1993 domain-containing protein [Lysobacter sp.]
MSQTTEQGAHPASPLLYRASVGVLARTLDRLAGLLDRAEDARRGDTAGMAALLEARLAPEMLPLRTQAEIVCNFALRTAFPLAGEPVPDYGEFPNDLVGLRARIARTHALLDDLAPERFDDAARLVRDRAGDADVVLPAERFLFEYALPNVLFHLSMAYAILRAQGVPIGKADFDGFHRYGAPTA